MGGWVDGWVCRLGYVKSLEINLDLIEIIEFCLKIYDLLRHPYLWVAVLVVGWMSGLIGGLMGRVISNRKFK